MLNQNLTTSLTKVETLAQNKKSQYDKAYPLSLKTTFAGTFLHYPILATGAAITSNIISYLPLLTETYLDEITAISIGAVVNLGLYYLRDRLFSFIPMKYYLRTPQFVIPADFYSLSVLETSDLIEEYNHFFKVELNNLIQYRDNEKFITYLCENGKTAQLQSLFKLGLHRQVINNYINKSDEQKPKAIEDLKQAETQFAKAAGISNTKSLTWAAAKYVAHHFDAKPDTNDNNEEREAKRIVHQAEAWFKHQESSLKQIQSNTHRKRARPTQEEQPRKRRRIMLDLP